MPIRNQNWYNLQATRRYPLDDKTTGEDDNGTPIRDDIIVDCHIRYPSTLGQYLFVQGITVTDNLVTVVIGAAERLTSVNCPTVAAITIEKPAAININEPLVSFVPGLSGWITFGPGIETNFVGRYSTPIQTFIGLRNARPYTPLPVPSLGKNTVAEFLQGIVNIEAESPVNATYHAAYTLPKFDPETNETNALPVQAIVFSTDAPTAEFNPQTFFLAPCSQRPESGTCNKTPLERINGIEPDCETGNINIVFQGGLNGLPFDECGGIDILTELGLTLVCNRVPDSEKKRKDDCPCENDDGVSEYCWPETAAGAGTDTPYDPDFNSGIPGGGSGTGGTGTGGTGTGGTGTGGTGTGGTGTGGTGTGGTGTGGTDTTGALSDGTFLFGVSCATLPICVSFNDCVMCNTGVQVKTDDFEIAAGSFSPNEIMAPPVCCPAENAGMTQHSVWLSTNSAGMNIALYRTCAGDWVYDKTVSTEFRLKAGGLRQTGGVVLNYVRVLENGRQRTKYFAVLLDAFAAELQLYRFDGSLLIKESSTPVNYVPGTWYKITAVATGTNGTATITAALYDITTSALVSTLTTNVTNYEVINGRSGIIANSATTYFNKFEIKAS